MQNVKKTSLFIALSKRSTRLCEGPARKSRFVNATIQISVSDFIPIKQPSTLVSSYLPAHQSPPTVPLSATPPPPRLPVQTDSRRPRPSGAVVALMAWALSAPRVGRGLASRPDTRPIGSVRSANIALYRGDTVKK